MYNELKYELIGVRERLSEDDVNTLYEEIVRYKKTIYSALKESGELNEPIVVKWVDKEPVYMTVNFKLKKDKIEVRLANVY